MLRGNELMKRILEYIELAIDMLFILITGNTPAKLFAKFKIAIGIKR